MSTPDEIEEAKVLLKEALVSEVSQMLDKAVTQALSNKKLNLLFSGMQLNLEKEFYQAVKMESSKRLGSE